MKIKNQIKIYFNSTNVNGFPKARILLNDVLIDDLTINEQTSTLTVDLKVEHQSHALKIERYGKTNTNEGQILEIIDVTIDDISIPKFILQEHTMFQFNDQKDQGSLYFSPNGVWAFNFETPIITWILDKKIIHESKYNQDYQFPWSYKLGPNSVTDIGIKLNNIKTKVKQIL